MTATQAREFLALGFTPAQIAEMSKGKGVATSKKEKPETSFKAVNSSASVLNAEVNFGGIMGAKFVEYTPKRASEGTLPSIYLTSRGDGFKGGLFFRVSGEGGKIEPLETLNKIKLHQQVLEENSILLDTLEKDMLKKAEELGLVAE